MKNLNSEKPLENTTIFKGVIKNLNKYGYNIYASCIIPINVQILKNILKHNKSVECSNLKGWSK